MQETLTYLHDQSNAEHEYVYAHTIHFTPPPSPPHTVGQFAWPYEPISSDDDIVLIAQEKKVHGSGTRLPFWFISVLSVNGSIYFNLQQTPSPLVH